MEVYIIIICKEERIGKTAYKKRNCCISRNQPFDIGCSKKFWIDLLCSVCGKWLYLFFGSRDQRIHSKIYAQSKAERNNLNLSKKT